MKRAAYADWRESGNKFFQIIFLTRIKKFCRCHNGAQL